MQEKLFAKTEQKQEQFFSEHLTIFKREPQHQVKKIHKKIK